MNSTVPPEYPGELADSAYQKATDNLHEAARDFTKKWLKAPQDSSFNEWYKACEKLEMAAVEYAKAKSQNAPGEPPAREKEKV